MVGRVEGKVAFVTGGARGQGRSHAVRLAQEGADIIVVDLCEAIPGVMYKGSTEADLAETVRQIEALDRRVVATKADVRDFDALKSAVDDGVAQLGRLDIVSGNAGIMMFGPQTHETPASDWATTLDINLTGVWHAVKAAVPHMIEAGNGGSIILTSSVAGMKSAPHLAPYNAAKHGVLGLMKTLALELAPHMIRSNAVMPTQVGTDMILNDAVYKLFFPADEHPTLEQAKPIFQSINVLPIPYVEPIDISNAVLWLASDESRYVTGVALPIDCGALIK